LEVRSHEEKKTFEGVTTTGKPVSIISELFRNHCLPLQLGLEKFVAYANERNEEFYFSELGNDFIYGWFGYAPGSEMQAKMSKREVSHLRVMTVLDDIYHGKPVKKMYSTIPVYIPENFSEPYEMYKKHLFENQKPRTCKTKLSRILVFLRFLEKNGTDLLKVDFQTIELFYKYISGKYNKTAQANIKYTIRGFLKWGEQTRIVSAGAAKLIDTIYGNKHERLPSTYTQGETQRILQAIDRSTKLGKRDYAMMVLLVQLGMRRSDICHLTLDCIRPEDNTIVFEQQKTGGHEKLPMTKSIRLALADYLKNVRPETQSNRLFVVFDGAGIGEPNGDSIVYNVLNRYMKKAGIDTEGKRHGPHSIRHSLSSSLLKSGVELPVISRILGHGSSEITKRYLWMDTEQMRNLSLEVPYAD